MFMIEDLKIKCWRVKDAFKAFKQMFPYILLSFWMILIFYFSSQQGSISTNVTNDFISNIIYFISNILNIEIDTETFMEITHDIFGPVRKCAHFTLFFILSLIVFSIANKSLKLSFKEKIIVTFLFCVFYACTDEIHQLFVPGRTGRLFDVFIDSLGVLTGIIFNIIYIKFNRRMC